jgi:hypothetical protein
MAGGWLTVAWPGAAAAVAGDRGRWSRLSVQGRPSAPQGRRLWAWRAARYLWRGRRLGKGCGTTALQRLAQLPVASSRV